MAYGFVHWLSPRGSGSDPWPVYVGFVVELLSEYLDLPVSSPYQQYSIRIFPSIYQRRYAKFPFHSVSM
jgi:hypothetical protein